MEIPMTTGNEAAWTPRERRVIRALRHEPPDRIPVFDNYWEEFAAAARQVHGLPKDASLETFYDVDIQVLVPDETPFPSRAAILSENASEIIQRDGWGRVIRVAKGGGFFSQTLEPAFTSPGEFDRLIFEPPSQDGRYETLKSDAVVRSDRCQFVKTGGPFLRCSFMRGEEQFCMDLAGNAEFARAQADRMADHQVRIGLEALRRSNRRHAGMWIYDDMAFNQGPMFSPGTFEKVFLPAYRRMCRTWKAAGARFVLFHSDGNIEPLLEMLIAAGVDAIHPVEARAGMDLPRLKERFGKRLAFIGGMCNSDVLPNGPVERIREQARRILEAGRDGGVVIGTHSVGPDVPVAHYDAYRRFVREYSFGRTTG